MALVLADRVRETTTTTGTGTITLAGAVAGFQSFAVIGTGNTTYYTINGGAEWEVGIGTYTSSGTTLSRDTVLASSNAGALVNFSAGIKDVFVTYPAGKSVNYDSSGNVGIGTSSPKARLQASAAAQKNAPTLGSAADAPFYLSNIDPSYGLVTGVNASDGHVWLQAQRTDGTATAYNITLNEAGGNVGIGTSSPTSGFKLDVNGSAVAGSYAIGQVDQHLLYDVDASNIGIRIGTGGPYYKIGTTGSSNLRLDNSSGGDVALSISGTTYVTLKNTTGNVGIGTSTPARKISVVGSVETTESIYIGGGANNENSVQIGDGRTGSNFAYIDLIGDTTYTDYGLRIIRDSAGANATSTVWHRGTGTLFIATMEAASISFNTNNTQRFVIDGATGLLNSLPTYNNTATGSTVVVTSTGAIRRTSSSIKYKKDVENLDPALVTNAVNNLRPVYYRTKNAEGDDKASWSHIGLIAEEVHEVEPRLVRYRTAEVETDEEGNRVERELEVPEPEDVDYARLSVLLLAKVKELETRIAVLEAR